MATSRSLVRAIARVLAIALAVGIVGWLVMRAQRDGREVDLPVTPNPTGEILELPAGLSSSKSLVLEPAAAEPPPPASVSRRTRKTVISPLKDSKAGLIEPAAEEPPALLFGSKSGPVPAAPPAPAAEPRQP